MIDTFLLISTVNLFWKMIRSACVHSPSVASLNPEGALPGANVPVVVTQQGSCDCSSSFCNFIETSNSSRLLK